MVRRSEGAVPCQQDWRINLQKLAEEFMDNFITIRRRDDTAVPLLAPNQDIIYLRENIRSRLLVTAWLCRVTSKRLIARALENVSTPGYVLTTILMMPPPKRSSTRWTS